MAIFLEISPHKKTASRPLAAAYLSLDAPGLVHLCSLEDFTILSQDLSISVLKTKDFSAFAQDLPGLVPQQTLSQLYKRIVSYRYQLEYQLKYLFLSSCILQNLQGKGVSKSTETFKICFS